MTQNETLEKLERRINIAEVARYFEVHPNTMSNWKKYRKRIYRALIEWYAQNLAKIPYDQKNS